MVRYICGSTCVYTYYIGGGGGSMVKGEIVCVCM